MKLVSKTMEKVVLEISAEEIKKDGFLIIWDKIREVYPINKFDIFSVGTLNKNDEVTFIELTPKK